MRRSNVSLLSLMGEYPEAPDTTLSHARFRGRGFPGGGKTSPFERRITGTELPGSYSDYEPEWYDPRDFDPRKMRYQWRKGKLRKFNFNAPSPFPKIRYLPPAPWNPPTRVYRILRRHPWFRLYNIYDYLQRPPQEGHHDMTGWTLICDTEQGPKTEYKTASFDPGLPCGTPGQVPDGTLPNSDIPDFPGFRRWIAFGRYAPIGPVGRMILDEQWTRPPSMDGLPWLPPVPGIYDRRPALPPWISPPWPHAPIKPYPPPYNIIPDRPFGPPILDEKTDAGNKRKLPDGPVPLPKGRDKPNDPKRPKPPKPRTKEKKIFGPVKKGILEIWDAATELEDTVECFLGTVPKHILRKARLSHKGNTSKLRLMWMVWDHIDAAAAVDCVIQNHYEDKLVGKLHQMLKKKGLGIGFFGTPYRRTLGGELKQRFK